MQDDHDVRIEVVALLRDAGCQVFESANGRTAVPIATPPPRVGMGVSPH